MNTKELYESIREYWDLSQKSYRRNVGLDKQEQQIFALNHINLHLAKRVGQIATEIEKAEHNGQIDIKKMLDCPYKIILAGFRLAAIINLPHEDLEKQIKTWVQSKHS